MTFFEQAVAADGTPEAFEGLSWAAWWLDHLEMLFEARERAYHLYRKRGDTAGAARMATWLACDQLDVHGAVAGGSHN
jgi:LuxR family transcriptional regulator, maltose regulon positive regulatory protein